MSSRSFLPLALLLLLSCKQAQENSPHAQAALPSKERTVRDSMASASAQQSGPSASVSSERSPAPQEVCAPLPIHLEPFLDHEEPKEFPTMVDGDTLAPFFQKLSLLLRKKASSHVRIGVYGDSNMSMDWMTGAMRRLFQSIFGDGGHGFLAVGGLPVWYNHMDIRYDFKPAAWSPLIVSIQPVRDEAYGISGIASQSRYGGAFFNVMTSDPAKSPIGHHASRFGVYYLKQPQGGVFDVMIDGQPKASLDSKSETLLTAYEEYEAQDAEHRFQIKVKTAAPVRLLGVVLERNTPSVIIDSYGTSSLGAESLSRERRDINRQMLKTRKLDLVVYLVGTNLSSFVHHKAWMRDSIQNHREALPGLPIILMSPPDLSRDGGKTSEPRIIRIGQQLKEIAQENQTAFWDYRAAMGGDRSIERFRRRGLAWGDLIHLGQKGAMFMGKRMARAIYETFARYAEKHPKLGCEKTDRPVSP